VDGDGNEDRWDYVGCFAKDYNLDFADESYTPGMTPTVRPPAAYAARPCRASRGDNDGASGASWVLVYHAPVPPARHVRHRCSCSAQPLSLVGRRNDFYDRIKQPSEESFSSSS